MILMVDNHKSWAGCSTKRGNDQPAVQWDFQDPKMEVR